MSLDFRFMFLDFFGNHTGHQKHRDTLTQDSLIVWDILTREPINRLNGPEEDGITELQTILKSGRLTDKVRDELKSTFRNSNTARKLTDIVQIMETELTKEYRVYTNLR